MTPEIQFVVMMWGAQTTGKPKSKFSPSNVNNIYLMLQKTQKKPFRLICVGDSSEGLRNEIEFVEIPPSVRKEIKDHGGHFAKLYLFSEEFREYFPGRFIFLDLDVVILDDLADVFYQNEVLTILEGSHYAKIKLFSDPRKHQPGRSISGFTKAFLKSGFMASLYYLKYGDRRWCMFNSSFMVVPETRFDVWSGFDTLSAKQEIKAMGLIGTDQAWLQIRYPAPVNLLTNKDGFWRHKYLKEFLRKNKRLPEGAKFVAFPGRHGNPWTLREDRVLRPVVEQYPHDSQD